MTFDDQDDSDFDSVDGLEITIKDIREFTKEEEEEEHSKDPLSQSLLRTLFQRLISVCSRS